MTSEVFLISAAKRASAERRARPVCSATARAVANAWRANSRPAAMQTTQATTWAGSPRLPVCRDSSVTPASIRAA